MLVTYTSERDGIEPDPVMKKGEETTVNSERIIDKHW